MLASLSKQGKGWPGMASPQFLGSEPGSFAQRLELEPHKCPVYWLLAMCAAMQHDN